MNAIRLIPLFGCIIFLGGCQGTWEAFAELQVGEPIPPDSIFAKAKKSDESGKLWHEFSMLFPICANSSSIYVDQDENGIIKTKSYSALSTTDLVLFQMTGVRFVIERPVPKLDEKGLFDKLPMEDMPAIFPDELKAGWVTSTSLCLHPFGLFMINGVFGQDPVVFYPNLIKEIRQEHFCLEYKYSGISCVVKTMGKGRIRIEWNLFSITPPCYIYVLMISEQEQNDMPTKYPGELKINGKSVETAKLNINDCTTSTSTGFCPLGKTRDE